MTPLTQSQKDALRVRIAEILGWTWRTREGDRSTWLFPPALEHRTTALGCTRLGAISGVFSDSEAPNSYRWGFGVSCPNFTGSLDAMHEAEKTLTEHQWIQYINAIDDAGPRDPSVSCKHFVHASAEQKALRFVLTHDEKLPWEDAR